MLLLGPILWIGCASQNKYQSKVQDLKRLPQFDADGLIERIVQQDDMDPADAPTACDARR